MRIAVLFENLGPYHIARLSALASRCDLLAIEVNATSTDYGWHAAAEVPFERIILPTGRRQSRSAMVRALTAFQPDAVFVPGWNDRAPLAALLWADRTAVPAILMSDSQEIDFPRRHWKEAIKRQIVAGFSGALVAGIPQAVYARRLGTAPSAIRPGYDVVDNRYFETGAEAARAERAQRLERHSLPEDYFLVSARFVAKKNLPALLEAYAGYRTALPDGAWDLILLGDGALRQHITERIAALGLTDHVHLPGFRQYDELPDYYGLARALILPSVSEQWGLVVNEAMAAGLPVLVSERCGCATDLVETGVNGFTFAPDDIAGLTGLMLHLTGLPKAECAAMSAASRRIVARWSPETFGDNALELAALVQTRHRATLSPPVRLALELALR